MKLVDLYEKLNGTVDGFTPAIVAIENIETGEMTDKFVMIRDESLQQVFGTTQSVLDVINLTDDELIHYITEWTRACGESLEEGLYRSSSTKANKNE